MKKIVLLFVVVAIAGATFALTREKPLEPEAVEARFSQTLSQLDQAITLQGVAFKSTIEKTEKQGNKVLVKTSHFVSQGADSGVVKMDHLVSGSTVTFDIKSTLSKGDDTRKNLMTHLTNDVEPLVVRTSLSPVGLDMLFSTPSIEGQEKDAKFTADPAELRLYGPITGINFEGKLKNIALQEISQKATSEGFKIASIDFSMEADNNSLEMEGEAAVNGLALTAADGGYFKIERINLKMEQEASRNMLNSNGSVSVGDVTTNQADVAQVMGDSDEFKAEYEFGPMPLVFVDNYRKLMMSPGEKTAADMQMLISSLVASMKESLSLAVNFSSNGSDKAYSKLKASISPVVQTGEPLNDMLALVGSLVLSLDARLRVPQISSMPKDQIGLLEQMQILKREGGDIFSTKLTLADGTIQTPSGESMNVMQLMMMMQQPGSMQ